VRRNGGRVGAALAPREIRRWLWRLTPWDPHTGIDLAGAPPLDAGDVRIAGTLEESQESLGKVIAGLLKAGTVPVVLGGGHETAYGHYLGYLGANLPVGVINIDAHLDVRPLIDGKGHSGSPFRQMLEHSDHPLPGHLYHCLGVQPSSLSRAHWEYVRQRGGTVHLAGAMQTIGQRDRLLARCWERIRSAGCRAYVSMDADVVRMSEMPGVSAPNPDGIPASHLRGIAQGATPFPELASIDLVEINPLQDRDGQSARWGALVIWAILMGLAARGNVS
jgi:formiminoglutamase